MSAPALPRSLATNPRLSQWVRFCDGQVEVASGKVELGQGIVTAIAQIAAQELCVGLDRIKVVSGETPKTPDEIYTAGSQSVELSGTSVRMVCATLRETLTQLAAEATQSELSLCAVDDGQVLIAGRASGIDYWNQIDRLELDRECDGAAPFLSVPGAGPIGKPVWRLDLPTKIFGHGFIHDIVLDGMKHARILRGALRGASLVDFDEERVRRAANVDIVRLAGFSAFVADRSRDADLALQSARNSASWAVEPIDGATGTANWLTRQPTNDRTIQIGKQPSPSNRELTLRFSRPYLSHGSIGPSCAIARLADSKLEVWTHSQGVEPLKGALAKALAINVEDVIVRHRHGAGCYGHNGADDAAFDAALIATRYPGTPIRVLWSRHDELSSAPLGAAMVVDVAASLGEDNLPTNWQLQIWSGSHGQRPGMAGRINLLGAQEAGLAPQEPDILDVPDTAGGGATRNAISPYRVEGQTIVHHLITRPAPMTSALRGLGAQVNVMAIEGMIGELAAMAGVDEVAYRLRLLDDARARHVLERCAQICNWEGRDAAGTGAGLGIAYSRYKNHAGYVAIAAKVVVDDEVKVSDIWCVADAGLVINPDGARNQIEGGIVQAASWTLKEAWAVGDARTASRGWDDYPILRFSEVPRVSLELVEAAHLPPLGVGEVAVGPATAAIANAVSHALGVRVSTLPLTRQNIEAAIFSS